jgi:hypothetical protein
MYSLPIAPGAAANSAARLASRHKALRIGRSIMATSQLAKADTHYALWAIIGSRDGKSIVVRH